jgi:hypothetical protein
MRIDTSEPSLISLFEKGQVGLIRTEFMRKDDVIANTNELLEIYKKENAALAAENERLRKAGDCLVAAYCMGDSKVEKWKEYPVVRQWLAAKGVQS